MVRDSLNTQTDYARGGLSVRPSLPGQARPGVRSRVRIGAASLAAGVVLLGVAGCGGSGPVANGTARPSATSAVTGWSPAGSAPASAATGAQGVAVPEPAHTMVVVMENHSYADIIGNSAAPFINELAGRGALFTRSSAITHPSEPNYLALFSGSTQGVTSDACPVSFTGGNLAAQLQAAGKTFVGYSESLPSARYTGCSAGDYARKHAPWVDFPALPATVNQPFSAMPSDYSKLPTVSFVVPNLCNDMHDCSVQAGDESAKQHLGPYVDWAATLQSCMSWHRSGTTKDTDGSGAKAAAGKLVKGRLTEPGTLPKSAHGACLRA